jgi:hypothetical protein
MCGLHKSSPSRPTRCLVTDLIYVLPAHALRLYAAGRLRVFPQPTLSLRVTYVHPMCLPALLPRCLPSSTQLLLPPPFHAPPATPILRDLRNLRASITQPSSYALPTASDVTLPSPAQFAASLRFTRRPRSYLSRVLRRLDPTLTTRPTRPAYPTYPRHASYAPTASSRLPRRLPRSRSSTLLLTYTPTLKPPLCMRPTSCVAATARPRAFRRR